VTAQGDPSRTSPERAKAIARDLERHGIKKGRFMNVGCATGETIYHLRDMGWEVAGVELNPHTASIAQQSGLDVRNTDLSASDFELASFNVVCFDNVLEHLPDPCAALSVARGLLKPNGVVYIRVPNWRNGVAPIAAWVSRMTRLPWIYSQAPYHLFDFSPKSLRTLLESQGFEVLSTRLWGNFQFFYAVGHLGWFDELRKAIRGKSTRKKIGLCLPHAVSLFLAAVYVLPFWILGMIVQKTHLSGTGMTMIAVKSCVLAGEIPTR